MQYITVQEKWYLHMISFQAKNWIMCFITQCVVLHCTFSLSVLVVHCRSTIIWILMVVVFLWQVLSKMCMWCFYFCFLWKQCLSDSRPACLSDKQFEPAIKYISRKFPNTESKVRSFLYLLCIWHFIPFFHRLTKPCPYMCISTSQLKTNDNYFLNSYMHIL